MKICFPVLTFRPGSFFAPTGTAMTESEWEYRINRNRVTGLRLRPAFLFSPFPGWPAEAAVMKTALRDCVIRWAPGSVFLRRPEVEHLIRVDAESGWLEYWLHLGNFAWPFFRNYLSLRDDSLTGYFDPSPEWFARFDMLLNRLETAPEDALLEYAMELCTFAADCVRQTRGGGEEEDMVHRGCEFLGTNFAENRDLHAFCRKNGWGYERFRKLFTDRIGISPNRYRIQRRTARPDRCWRRPTVRSRASPVNSATAPYSISPPNSNPTRGSLLRNSAGKPRRRTGISSTPP